MLASLGGVFLGIGVAVVGFLVVALVCVVILRLLSVVLPTPGDVEITPHDEHADEGTAHEPEAAEETPPSRGTDTD